jgi:hypothetical protein
MATVDALVNAAVDRADSFALAAADAIASIDARKGSIGYAHIDISNDEISAKFTAVPADTTPMPVYEDTTVAMPSAPALADLHGITPPVLPDAPSINTSGLFTAVMPSAVMPDWNEANPALHVDDIYNDLKNLAAPILQEFDFPTITPLSIRQAPELVLPEYIAADIPDQMPDPSNYAEYMENKYRNALPEMKAFIDDVVEGWVSKFAPEYYEQRDTIHAKIMSGVEGGVLPDQFEEAMYSRARDKVENEYSAAELTILEQQAKRGFVVPPGAVFAGLNRARLQAADSLSNQATDIYIERRKTEVQHLQFVLNMASTQIQGVRSLAIQYASTGLQLIGQSVNYAKDLAGMLAQTFEHVKSKHEFSLALMKALNEQYETRLKVAMAGLEGYKLELEAAKLVKDVEFKQVEVIKAQIETQTVMVNRYSAMVDAIAKRAVVDELKIKEYSVRAQVFETQIRAKVAAFEAYKAAIDGDKAKLQGELAKLEIFNSQLKAADLSVEVQSEILKADIETNRARITQYSTQLDAYKIGSQIALQKFTAGAEIKKLGLEIYKTNVDANIEIYKGQLQADLALIEARISAFKGNIQSLANFYELQQKYTQLDLTKTEAIATGFSSMASSALQSLGTMVSQAA